MENKVTRQDRKTWVHELRNYERKKSKLFDSETVRVKRGLTSKFLCEVRQVHKGEVYKDDHEDNIENLVHADILKLVTS